jgi:hypothetical protein
MSACQSPATGAFLESETRFPGARFSATLTKDELLHILSLLLQYQISYRTEDKTRAMNSRAMAKVTAMVDSL